MPIEVILPKVDMDMAHGRIAGWHVAEGEAVAKGDPLFDIETDKATMEVESPADGRLHHVTEANASDVPIGTAIAWIYAEGETVGKAPPGSGDEATPADGGSPATASADAGSTKLGSADEGSAEVSGSMARERLTDSTQSTAAMDVPPQRNNAVDDAGTALRATPAARRIARERGIELRQMHGSGPSGRVQRSDLERDAATAALEVHAPDPVQTPFQDRSSAAQWAGDLYVRTIGSGDAMPVVMIHGFAADATGWAGIERDLASRGRVHQIELPNHGRSPRRRVANFADLASQVRHAFDALGLDRVHLVGHSLGGAVALALADTRPRAVADLTLIAPAGLGPEMAGDVLAGIARASQPESLGPWLRCMTGDPDRLSWGYVQAAALARAEPDLRAAQAEMLDTLFPDGTQGFDLVAALQRVQGPARIIWGRRDRVVPWRHALQAPGHIALHFFDGVGHIPHVEIGEAVSRILK